MHPGSPPDQSPNRATLLDAIKNLLSRSIVASAFGLAHTKTLSTTPAVIPRRLSCRAPSAEPAQAGRARLHCIVRDSGIGLTRAEIGRLFRPFAQASVEIAQRYGGAGLGLSIVKTLAKRMGGDLTVTSTPGGGSAFHFTAILPIARDQEVAAAPASQRR